MNNNQMVTGHRKHTFFILFPSNNGTECWDVKNEPISVYYYVGIYYLSVSDDQIILFFIISCISEHSRLHNYYYGNGVLGIIFVFFRLGKSKPKCTNVHRVSVIQVVLMQFLCLACFDLSKALVTNVGIIISIVYLQLTLVDRFLSS